MDEQRNTLNIPTLSCYYCNSFNAMPKLLIGKTNDQLTQTENTRAANILMIHIKN